MELQKLNNEELKMIVSAITAKTKRLRGSLANNIKKMNVETFYATLDRIARRELQIRQYDVLKTKIETNIKNNEL